MARRCTKNKASIEFNTTIMGIIEYQELRNEAEKLEIKIVPKKDSNELRI